MQIYEALKKDHEAVKNLLTQLVLLDESETEKRDELVTQIRDDLIPHSRAEEAVFYNSLRSFRKDKEGVMQGFNEHFAAESLLRKLQFVDKLSFSWKPTAHALKKAIEHHIEEEESKLFAAARERFTDEESEEMGKAFEALKPKIKDENIIQTTYDLLKNLMPPRYARRLTASELEKAL